VIKVVVSLEEAGVVALGEVLWFIIPHQYPFSTL